MKKKISVMITALLLTFSLSAAAVFADEEDYIRSVYFEDGAGIVSSEELENLNVRMGEISMAQECDVYAYTTSDFDGKTAQTFADDFYDENDLGYGADRSGIFLVLNFDSGDWAISTSGFGITAFTDAGQEYLMEQVTSDLRDDPAKALMRYADMCEDFLIQAHAGTPYDTGTIPGTEKGFFLPLDILAGIIFGVIIAFIIVSVQKSGLKTVRREAAAKNYMRPGSLNLTARNEQFLYNTVDRIEKESSGGGSSTHKSSSGMTHGGSSGKF